MTCWRCGAEIDENVLQCPACGAERVPRRRQAAGEAARRYQERMRQPPDAAAQKKAAEGRRRGSADAKPVPAPVRREKVARSSSQRPNRSHAEAEHARGARPLSPPPQQRVYDGEGGEPPRYIRPHEPQAIIPQARPVDRINWVRMLVIVLLLTVALCAGVYFYLSATDPGQHWLASQGMEAPAAAYHDIGRMYLENGSISRAVWALEIAQAKEPDDLETLLDLGKAYLGIGEPARAELAFSRAIEKWPAYPDSYILMIDLMMEGNRNYEAIQLVSMAIENEAGDYFSTLYTQMMPTQPRITPIATSYFDKEVDVFIHAEEGATIYYTMDGKDPVEFGQVYVYSENNPIHLEKGGWTVRAVARKDGIFSREQSQSYVVIQQRPDMPKANIQPGTYKQGQTLSFRETNDIVAIYYTTDGTRATQESKVYDADSPIKLRIGNTTVRAIAVNALGEESNEFSVTYRCEGTAKNSMSEKDTVGGLALMSTTRGDFEAKYGKAASEAPDGENSLGTYTKATYSFGYAVFLERPDREPVLAELSTTSSSFGGPRGTGVGTRMSDVIDAFRDVGGEEDADGGRNLYVINVTGGYLKMGFLEKLSDTQHKISYYHQMESNRQIIELTYYVDNGLVSRIEWLQYDP